MNRTTRRRIFLLALGTALLPAALSAQEIGVPYGATDLYPRHTGIDVLHYEIGVELPAEGQEIRGRTRILYEVTGATDPDGFALDFGAMAVDSVTVDGVAASWMHGDGALMVTVPPSASGARHEIEVVYRGEPADGLIFGATAAGARTVFADNWADRGRHWFPSIDHPSDKASVEFDVVAPAAWRVVANGVLVERTDLGDGRARTRWAESSEIPTYTMVIGATEFAVGSLGYAAGVELTAWSYPADSAAAAAMFSRTAEIVAFYDSLFGPYPYDKLAQVQSATKYGGMENSSAIFYSASGVAGALENPVTRSGNAGVVPHEIVHQWFGDAVTEADWNHVWLSEGFADYFAAVFFEFHGSPSGQGPEELARRMAGMRDQIREYQRQVPDAAIHDPGRGPGEYEGLLTPLNYDKGAWVLHMLRDRVSDAAFFEAVRDYYATFRDGVAWTADFERIVEAASGEDLGWFFAQWIGRAGHPALAVEHAPAGPGRVRIVLRQTQPGEPFRVPVDLGLEWEGGSRVERVWLEGADGEWTFETPAPVRSVVIDPGVRLLWEPVGE
ncbi:MAG TPA: M1 family aminopeptidase [Gemmatimonadota bacterium]|nr:M1 family aminopeptidase [Gemmatimonadota bacterium]